MKREVSAAKVACAVAAVMVLSTGCSSGGETSEPAPEAAATAEPAATTVPSAEATPAQPSVAASSEYTTPNLADILATMERAPTDVPEQYHDGSTGRPHLGTAFVLDDESRASAIEVGTKVMELYARPDVPADQWLRDLSEYLTFDATQAYQYVDPQNVPIRKVTGEANLTPASGDTVARVNVPTELGGYLVIVVRNDEHPNWEAEQIIPPETVSGDF